MHRARLLLCCALVACGTGVDAPSDDDSSTTDLGTSTGPFDAEPAVTYSEHVAPILARHCVACHAEGGIAPLALDDYAGASQFSSVIAAVTTAREMPPFAADHGGECGSFRDARWLDEEEIEVLSAWHEAGAPEGPPREPPPLEPLPELGGELLIAAMTTEYTPSTAQPDDYRCFVVPGAPIDGPELFVTGFAVRPGNAAVVHHVIVYAPKGEAATAQVQALDDAEEGPGYTCFGTAQVPAGVAAAWAPGGGATHYPPGTGIRLQPGAPLVLQLHYNTLAAGELRDRTEVDLEVVREGVRPARFAGLADLQLELPPGEVEAHAGIEVEVGNTGNITGPVDLLGVFPHMHTLGRTLEIDRSGPSDSGCVIDVPRWDFHWQRLYFYDEPIRLDPADRLSMRCTYDTRSRDEVTRHGEGTLDEMCVAGLLVVDP